MKIDNFSIFKMEPYPYPYEEHFSYKPYFHTLKHHHFSYMPYFQTLKPHHNPHCYYDGNKFLTYNI